MKTIGLGGATASLMMLLGINSTKAEDLQGNQLLLGRRLDQLAAAGQQPGAGALFSVEPNLAASHPVVGGAFPGSIPIPGSNTSLKVYGRVSETAVYYMSGGNPNGSPQNTTVGVNGQVQAAPLNNSGVAKARSNGIFLQSPRSSRLGFETRTPTPLGELRTVMEFDWAGSNGFVPGGTGPTAVSDNLIPRLRYAYGTLDGFLAGQATSNFSDPDAFGEILEFGGNVGEAGRIRTPQIRYTMPVAFGGSFSVSAETAETVIATGAGVEGSDAGVIPALTTSCTVTALSTPTICATTLLGSGVTPLNIAKASVPDLTAAWHLPRPWGHLNISAVVRPGLEVTDGRFFAKNYIGYGGHFSADVKPGWFGWAKDSFIVQFTPAICSVASLTAAQIST